MANSSIVEATRPKQEVNNPRLRNAQVMPFEIVIELAPSTIRALDADHRLFAAYLRLKRTVNCNSQRLGPALAVLAVRAVTRVDTPCSLIRRIGDREKNHGRYVDSRFAQCQG